MVSKKKGRIVQGIKEGRGGKKNGRVRKSLNPETQVKVLRGLRGEGAEILGEV